MLTNDESNYLNKIPKEKMVKVGPYDPKISQITLNLIKRINKVVPELEARHMGASSLELSGQNDIDIYIFCPKDNYLDYLPKLELEFGNKLPNMSTIKWLFVIDGFEVEMYLTDPTSESMTRQIKVFELLKNNSKLRKEYEEIKLTSANTNFREYQRRKYEFYDRILGN